MSLQEKILNWFRKQPLVWVPREIVERIAAANTHCKESYVRAQCQELVKRSLLESDGVRYRFNPQTYGPAMERQMIAWFNSL